VINGGNEEYLFIQYDKIVSRKVGRKAEEHKGILKTLSVDPTSQWTSTILS
jgi:hypothetical protein